jgi:hypothetical protein
MHVKSVILMVGTAPLVALLGGPAGTQVPKIYDDLEARAAAAASRI